MILYIESLHEARQFMSAARAFAQQADCGLQIGAVCRFGRAAASHTGAMAGVDEVYEAAFQRAGMVRVFEIDDVFDCANCWRGGNCRADRVWRSLPTPAGRASWPRTV